MTTNIADLNLTKPGARVHIVGIGGAGMSAIARILLESGAQVSGSDRTDNSTIAALIEMGAHIHIGHAASNVPADTDVILISSAVKDNNPEVLIAKMLGKRVIKRRDAFPYLLPDQSQIAVAGTHGKTTTTAMIAHVLTECGRDPSYIVGGQLLNTGTNAHAGKGSQFVVEADEYDYMFLGLTPKIAVITNIEHDHPDMFPTLDDMKSAFRDFTTRLPDDGLLIACADDPGSLLLAGERRAQGKPVQLYGINYPLAEYWGSIDPADDPAHTHFGVQLHDRATGERDFEQTVLALPGDHNVLNALAALAAAHAVGVPLTEASAAITTFQGTARRSEQIGLVNGAPIISDYGHHPTAIKAVLHGLRRRYPSAELWAIWQPHTYSRTRALAEQFATCFAEANHVLVTDVYASRESRAEGDPDGETMAATIWEAGHKDAEHTGSLESTAHVIKYEVKPGDVVVIFSAGDAPDLVKYL